MDKMKNNKTIGGKYDTLLGGVTVGMDMCKV
jgi:hypothetical protein